MAKKKTNKKMLVGTKEPELREISFEGNMPSTYEKNLRKVLAGREKNVKRN